MTEFLEEERIEVTLSEVEPLDIDVTDINYIPGYKAAEEERRSNELERISNEEKREDYYEDIKQKVQSGYFKGEKGDKGNTGDTGACNTITIGTVEKGETATATLTGTSPNQVLNLVLPKGDKGNTGSKGNSAYEVAVEKGFVGTEQEWLESLKADDKDYTIQKSNKLFINQFMGVLKSYFDNRTYNNENVFEYGHNTALDSTYDGGNKIDCSAFVGLGLMGIDFDNSPYASLTTTKNDGTDNGNEEDAGEDPDDTDTDDTNINELTVGNYPWAIDLKTIYYPKVSTEYPVRTASQMCQMMIEAGWEIKYADDFSNVERGDIVFYAKKNSDGTWVQPNRYKHVSHIAVVSSTLDNTNDVYQIGSNYPFKHTMFEVSTFGKIVLNTSLEKRTVNRIVAICRPNFGSIVSKNTGNIQENNGSNNIDDAIAEGDFYLITSNTGTLPSGVTSLSGALLNVKKTYNRWGKLYSIVQTLYIIPTNSTPGTRKASVYVRTNYCYRGGTYRFTNDYWSAWDKLDFTEEDKAAIETDLKDYIDEAIAEQITEVLGGEY